MRPTSPGSCLLTTAGWRIFEGRQITIDLFASEVACELASADFILGDRLDQPTRALVRQETQRRIFDPYTKMITTGKPSLSWLMVTNNWNAVCLANVTGTALALREDPQEKALYVAAAEKYIANFLKGFTDDGYCSEGIGYWNYGYGCFVRLGHMLVGATRGQVDLFAAAEGAQCRTVRSPHGDHARRVPRVRRLLGRINAQRRDHGLRDSSLRLGPDRLGATRHSPPAGGSMSSACSRSHFRTRRANGRPKRPAIETGSKTPGS